MFSLTAVAVLSALAPLVSAHGQVYNVVAEGVTNTGPNIYYDADSVNAATVTRKMYKASRPAYVLPTGFSDNSKMACEGASGAPKTLSVKAGDKVTINWVGATSEIVGAGGLTSRNPWVHAMGPIIDYLAPCNGDCSSTDASQLGWTKIAEAGLDLNAEISDDLRTRMTNKPEKYYPTASQGKGLWAMAKMVQDGSSWGVTIPSVLKDGQYILRSEMSAVHNPKTSDATSGPQVYIACIQLDVTNGGSTSLPAGTKAGSLYSADGDFANYDVYSDVYSFKLPGPALWTGASSGSGSGTTTSSTTAATSTKAATTSTKAAATTTSAKTAVASPTTTSSAAPAGTTTVDTTTTFSATTAAPSATKSCKVRRKRSVRATRAHRRRLAADAH